MKTILWVGALALATTNAWAGALNPQRFSSVREAPISKAPAVADEQGVRFVGELNHQLSESAQFHFSASDSAWRDFGAQQVDRAIESSMSFRLSVKDSGGTQWLTQIRSLSAHQDMDEFLPEEEDARRFEHQMYSISEGWQRNLMKGLSMEMFAGLAQCRYLDAGLSKFIPFGGVRLVRSLSWGELSASFGQGAAGGASTGIYGSQTERRVDFGTKVDLVEGLSLLVSCGLLKADGMFAQEDLMRGAPMLLTRASLNYTIADGIKGSVGYSRRQLIKSTDLGSRAGGSSLLLALTVEKF